MISILSTAPDGTDGCWLDQLAQVSDWQHTTTFPGGDSSATFSFQAPTDFAHSAVRTGRYIYAHAGAALVWAGRLDEPQRGQPWTLTATGTAALAKEHVITTAGSTLNTVVDAAITNGLPWTRPATLTSPAAPIVQYSTVDDALGQLVAQNGFWSLDVTGTITTPASVPAATLLMYLFDVPARTLQSYCNVVVVVYLNTSGATVSTTVVGSTTELAARGRIETTVDITARGNISLATAQAAGAAEIGNDTQPTWAAPFAAVQGSLLTIGGTPVDVATVRPGQTVRVVALHPEDFGAGTVDIPIGQVDYDDATRSVNLTALASAKTDLMTVLARAS